MAGGESECLLLSEFWDPSSEWPEDRSVLQEPRSNQGQKVLLLDFYLLVTYKLETSLFLVEVRGELVSTILPQIIIKEKRRKTTTFALTFCPEAFV